MLIQSATDLPGMGLVEAWRRSGRYQRRQPQRNNDQRAVGGACHSHGSWLLPSQTYSQGQPGKQAGARTTIKQVHRPMASQGASCDAGATPSSRCEEENWRAGVRASCAQTLDKRKRETAHCTVPAGTHSRISYAPCTCAPSQPLHTRVSDDSRHTGASARTGTDDRSARRFTSPLPKNVAALWIQSRWRAHRGQLSTQVLKQARQMRREYNAATFVQAHWRGRMGRDILRHLRVEVSAVLRCATCWAPCIACER